MPVCPPLDGKARFALQKLPLLLFAERSRLLPLFDSLLTDSLSERTIEDIQDNNGNTNI